MLFVGIKENNVISTNPFVVDAMLPIMVKHLNIRVGEHSGVSSFTGKKSKAKTTTALKIICSFANTQFPSRSPKFWQVAIQNFILRSKKVF